MDRDQRNRIVGHLLVWGGAALLGLVAACPAQRAAGPRGHGEETHNGRDDASAGGIRDRRCTRNICWASVTGLPKKIALFRTQVFGPKEYLAFTASLRKHGGVEGATVLDIGAGSGVLGLLALAHGAAGVVATEINPMGVRNARHNARLLGQAARVDVRQVSLSKPGAYSVIRAKERFDLIVANPPTLDRRPRTMADRADFDPGYKFVKSIIRGAPAHLARGGRLWLLHNEPVGLKAIRALANELGLSSSIIIDGTKTDFNQHRIRRTMRGYDGSYPIVEITRD